VIWDKEENVYKMWYQAYSVITPQNERYIMRYAVSDNGILGEKPQLGIVDFRGSTANNMVLMGNTQWALTNVIKDSHDSDPARRYKSLSWVDGSIAIAFFPDGIHWMPFPVNPVVKDTGDSHNILPFAETLGKYAGYLRPRVSGQKRGIGYFLSDNSVHWSPIEVILFYATS